MRVEDLLERGRNLEGAVRQRDEYERGLKRKRGMPNRRAPVKESDNFETGLLMREGRL